MADDIVSELRYGHAIACRCVGCAAAKEIEQLRAVGDSLCRDMRWVLGRWTADHVSMFGSITIPADVEMAPTAWEILRNG